MKSNDMYFKLKEEIHLMVNEIEDEATLFLLKADIVMWQKSYKKVLTDEQMKELNEAIEEDDKREGCIIRRF
jgi:hypothetical protein